jgi:hypothetical protein
VDVLFQNVTVIQCEEKKSFIFSDINDDEKGAPREKLCPSFFVYKMKTTNVKISVWQKTTKMASTWTTAVAATTKFVRENVEIVILGFIEVIKTQNKKSKKSKKEIVIEMTEVQGKIVSDLEEVKKPDPRTGKV